MKYLAVNVTETRSGGDVSRYVVQKQLQRNSQGTPIRSCIIPNRMNGHGTGLTNLTRTISSKQNSGKTKTAGYSETPISVTIPKNLSGNLKSRERSISRPMAIKGSF